MACCRSGNDILRTDVAVLKTTVARVEHLAVQHLTGISHRAQRGPVGRAGEVRASGALWQLKNVNAAVRIAHDFPKLPTFEHFRVPSFTVAQAA